MTRNIPLKYWNDHPELYEKTMSGIDDEASKLISRITALETELATERIAAETAAIKVFELGERVAELEAALQELEESVTVQHIGRFGKLQTDCRVCRAVGVARVALDTHEKP